MRLTLPSAMPYGRALFRLAEVNGELPSCGSASGTTQSATERPRPLRRCPAWLNMVLSPVASPAPHGQLGVPAGVMTPVQ
jgi:hypothetical protein